MSHADAGGAPPPEQQIIQLLLGKFVSRALTIAADLSIADLLAEGACSVGELAERSNSKPDGLYRVLRALAAVGVFTELPNRRFENNPLSNTLRAGVEGSTRAMVRWINDDFGWRMWGNLDHTVLTGEPSAFPAFGTKDIFGYLRDNPSSFEKFQDAMSGFSQMTAGAVVEGYDFSGIGKLVDVGGGHGMLLSTVLARYPGMSGVLFDRPEVVGGAGDLLTELGQAERIEAVGGDFFAGVPAGGDAYIMKHIIHDWEDAESQKILRNCRDAMNPGGKVLIVDHVVTDTPESIMGKLIDLEMLAIGGRERSEEEFAALLASSGLKLVGVHPTPSPVSVVEAVAA